MAQDTDSGTTYTTITVQESVKQDLDEYRDGRSWSEFLEKLRQEHADPVTLTDAEEIAEIVSESIETEPVAVEEVVSRLKNQLSMANEPGVEVDTEELLAEIDRLKEIVEQVPERTADQFERKYR